MSYPENFIGEKGEKLLGGHSQKAGHKQRSLRIASKQNMDSEISREKAEYTLKQTGKAVSSRTQVVSLDP
jgi:hypothetical protein